MTDRSALPAEARMGNDIARQFAHLPAEAAVERVATHLRKFWDPRMRRRLLALVAAGDDSLDPLLAAAARVLPEAAGPTMVDRAEMREPSGG